jgi:tetratricopeptide (TPR) repeat protein
MAIYHDPNSEQRGDTFAPPKPAALERRPARSSPAILAAILVGGAIVVGVVVVGMVTFRPQVQLRTPVEESLPYVRTAAYLPTYDEVERLVGPNPRVAAGPRTRLDWSVAGGGIAVVHLQIDGDTGKTQVFAEWEREREAWRVRSASYLAPSGEQIAVPLGAGNFLSRYDLAAWRAADPDTALGRGQRELIEGRPIQAIQLFTEVIGKAPQNVDALLWRGRSFEAVGNVPKALADYQRILATDPNHAAALARLDGLRASPGVDQELKSRPGPAEAPPKPSRPSTLIPR